MKTQYTLSALFVGLAMHAPTALADNNHSHGHAHAMETIAVKGQTTPFLSQSQAPADMLSSPDMRQYIASLPGVNINSNGGISGIMQYRGLIGERVRVNVNGSEIVGAGPNGMDPPLSQTMSVPFQTVTLHQGIAPVSVGAEVIGGALEIDEYQFALNSSSDWRHEGGLSLNVADNDSRNIGGLWYAGKDNYYVSASADYQTGDNFVSGNGLEVPSTFYQRAAWKLRGGIEAGQHRLDAVIAHRDTNEAGTPALAMDILFVDSTWLRLNHQYDSGQNWVVKTHLFGNDNSHDMDNSTLRTAPPLNSYRLNQTVADARGAKSVIHIDGDQSDTKIGVDYLVRANDSYITNPNNMMFFIHNFNDIERERWSAFVETEQSFDNAQWQFGVRATNVSLNAGEIGSNMAMMNPNVSALQNTFNSSDRKRSFALVDMVSQISLNLGEHVTFNTSAGIKQRAPTYSELYSWFPLGVSGGLADGNNYIGNMALQEETAKKVDVGIHYHTRKFGVFASAYVTRIDNYIQGQVSETQAANNIAMMSSGRLPLQWQNTDALIKGVELKSHYMISSAWQLTGQIEMLDGKQLNSTDKYLYRMSPNNAQLVLDYSQGIWDWQVAVKAFASQDDVAPLQNERSSAGYGVVNSRLRYALNPQLSVSLVVDNLFDKHYEDHLASVNRVRNSDLAVGAKIPGKGRNIGVSLQYRL